MFPCYSPSVFPVEGALSSPSAEVCKPPTPGKSSFLLPLTICMGAMVASADDTCYLRQQESSHPSEEVSSQDLSPECIWRPDRDPGGSGQRWMRISSLRCPDCLPQSTAEDALHGSSDLLVLRRGPGHAAPVRSSPLKFPSLALPLSLLL